MAFISNCPKCQKPVLVPEGPGHDAVVQCPACLAEYSLGEIIAAVPALIVVHPGSVPAAELAPLGEPATAAAGTMEGGFFAAHRVEPTLHDADALDLAGEGVALADHEVPLVHEGEQVVAVEGQPSEAGIEPFAEPPAVPLEGEGHELSDADGKPEAWGGQWGGFAEGGAHAEGEESEIGLAEPEEDMQGVNFAEITGKAAPGTAAVAAGGAAVAVEPLKKKKRKREANPVVRVIGIIFFGLLAVPCAFALAIFVFHEHFDFLPAWLQPQAKDAAKTNGTKPTKTPDKPDSAEPKGSGAVTDVNAAGGDAAKTNDGAGAKGSAAGAPDAHAVNPGTSESKPAAGTEKEVAVDEKPKPKAPPKEESSEPEPDPDLNPAAVQPDKPDVAPPAVVAPIGKPKKETPKPETPSKPATSDPFDNPSPAAPVKEKPKTEPKPAIPGLESPETPLKPETPSKPDTPIKPATPETPAIKPEPPKVKPEANAEVKPAAKLGPLGAPTYPSDRLEKALARVARGAAGPLKGDVYHDWCQLAEVATFTQEVSVADKQALQDLVKKLAGDPRAITELGDSAKKLLDDKKTEGGIVLTGKVAKIAQKNGLFAAAIHIEGMQSPVMVFSAHPLDVKETQSVLVLGALIGDPAKNLPGYTGKQPVIVWADFAVAIP